METQNPDDWRAVFELDINAVRMMRDHLNYAIKMWPGAPARPFEEQEFLLRIRDQMASMAMDYSFHHMEVSDDK
jgi:hypothetical protein